MTTEKTVQQQSPAAESSTERDLVVDNMIKNHVLMASGVSLVPIPVFDMIALSSTQMNMLRSLSEHYELPFDETSIKSMVVPMLSGSLPVLGVVGLSSLVKVIPGIGTLAGSAGLSVTAGAITYAVGQVFAKHCAAGGSLEDFDSQQAQHFMKEELEHGKAFVRNIQNELRHRDDEQVEEQSDTEASEGKKSAA
ncbi:MAG: DUF697 domain-containing protein [Gammaproteobacteria bacterium]|nr:DUF697 domain-containing protein [Gammaproteobacteria bacterium]